MSATPRGVPARLYARRDPAGRLVGFVPRPATAEALDLLPHPEGGWFRETWRTTTSVSPPGYAGERSTATGIYFLLGPGDESCWHLVTSDEVWMWHSGGPLSLVLGGSGARPGVEEEIRLGVDLAGGEVPHARVPGGVWQRAKPAGGREVLVSCVVSPGFDFADFHA